MNARMPARASKYKVVCIALLWAAAGASLALAAARVFFSISLRHPSQILTSGLEEEALFSIWKFIQGQAVYSDPFFIPFSGSYFNWLFYATYGSLAWLVLHTLRLGPAWIPTITHLISLAFAILCVPVTAFVLRAMDLPWLQRTRWTPWVVGVLVAFNPLVGWWNITARPDIGALCLELAALYLAIQFAKTSRRRFLWGALVTAFLSWSFRQTAVNVISGFCLYLLFSRRWKDFFVTAGLSGALYAATFSLGGTNYWANTITRNGAAELLVRCGVNNLVSALLKSPFLLSGAVALAAYLCRSGWRHGSPAVNLLAPTLAFALVWGSFTSMKVGASQNYYMAQAALSLLLALAFFLPDTSLGLGQRFRLAFGAAILSAQAAACLAVLFGAKGRINIRQDQVPTLALQAKLAGLEGPILVTERLYNLPWINPTTPHFVYAYVYRVGPLKDRQDEGGGLEGLVRQSYFKRIILPKKTRPSEWPELDGRYACSDEDAWFRYYKPATPPHHE